MQLLGLLEIGFRKLVLEPALAEPEKQLLACLHVDPLGLGAGVQLGQQSQELGIDLTRLNEVVAQTAMERIFEVLRPELGQDLVQLGIGMGDARRERVALEARSRPRAAWSRRGPC